MTSIADLARGAGETAATVGSGIAAQPLSGLAGLWALLTGQDDPGAAISRVQEGMTYRPRGKEAQNALQTIGDLASYYDAAKHTIADPVAATLGPGAGTAAFVAPDALLSLLPFMKAENLGSSVPVGALAQGGKVGVKAAADLTPIPELAERYPQTSFPVLARDATGNMFASKDLSPEALKVQAIRQAAQKDIDAGNYTPHFDPEQRTNIDPGTFPTGEDTLTDALPKKPATIEKYRSQFDTPEIRARLNAAFDLGSQDPAAKDWYAVRQLQQEFIKALGAKKGNEAFKAHFADAMAATTGGADPTANLLTAGYGNFIKNTGASFPSESFDLPYPIGGRYVAGNIDMYDKALLSGTKPMTAAGTPKRFNFAGNFLGRLNNATIDEQMMTLFDPKLKSPPGDSYGVLENILADVARERGVAPMNFQDVAWLGAKRMKDPGAIGKPMISHVNEMLERTSRVTGKSPQEVLQGFIRGNMPMYGLGGATVGTLAAQPGGDQ